MRLAPINAVGSWRVALILGVCAPTSEAQQEALADSRIMTKMFTATTPQGAVITGNTYINENNTAGF